jgi:Protein of unknown function (DUF2587)
MSDLSKPEVVAPDSVRPDDVSAGDPARSGGPDQLPTDVADVESPAKIIRIGAMVKQLLEEVRNTTLDEAAREQLRDIYDNSIVELRGTLSPELGDELERLTLDFDDDAVPTEAQLRIAKAQLVGWLEGLFHGIQATLMAQQMAARGQLEVMRSQLPAAAGQGAPNDGPPHGGPGYI